ncbi:unnamed protein product [Caenorhabditis auriculariae]|uniref:ShKT domain-containing protein n=1 Tax=Caenorhabditis auriculariae TaxID=2777116 RepID=A0A8S1HHA3_9PELO|nr:unnamed protein product [Caenorhabditis auriculariae]
MWKFVVVGISLISFANCQQNNGTRQMTCSTNVRSACFAGRCPTGFQCINGGCCDDKSVVIPGGDCQDYVADCSSINCKGIDVQDFARANCARTCNLCYDTGPVSPEYACTDLLNDCRERTSLCRDINFIGMMALYCPRTCALGTYVDVDAQCGDTLANCTSRGEFCTSSGVSAYQKTVGCGRTCGLCSGESRPTDRGDHFLRDYWGQLPSEGLQSFPQELSVSSHAW